MQQNIFSSQGIQELFTASIFSDGFYKTNCSSQSREPAYRRQSTSHMLWIDYSLFILRCIKSEGEIEKLQSKLVEMKKKLDNTTAAMQELGRENQSLQVSFDFKQLNLLILSVGLVRNEGCVTFMVGYLSTVIKVFLWCTRAILLSVG